MGKSNSLVKTVLNSAINSIWVPVLFLANIFLTGFLFGSTGIVPGFSDHLWDLCQGILGAAIFSFLVSGFRKKNGILSHRHLAIIFSLPPLINSTLPGTMVWLFISKPAGEKILGDFLISYSSLFGQFFIFALLVGALKYSREMSKTVASQFRMLSFIRSEMDSGLAESKSRILKQIQEITRSSVKSFESANAEEIRKDLQKIIDEIVRPLSNELDAEALSQENFGKDLAKLKTNLPKVPLRQILKEKIPWSLASNRLISLILYINFTGATMFYFFGINSIWQSFAPFIVISQILYLGWQKIVDNKRGNIFFVLLLGIMMSLAQSFAFILICVNHPDYDQLKINLIAFSIFLQAFGPVIYGISFYNITEKIKMENRYNVDLAGQIRAIRQQLWHFHKRIARELHGGLQSRLQVAALKAEKVDLESLYADFTLAISTRESDLQIPLLSEALDNLVEFWDGICKINLKVTRESLEAIEKNLVVCEYLLELIRESINNAIKHAESDEIEISVSVSGNLIELEVDNNVNKANSVNTSNQSLGTKIFKELAESWNLEIGDKQSKFVATLSLNS